MPPTPSTGAADRSAPGTTVSGETRNHTPVGGFKIRGGLVYVDELCRAGGKPSGLISATRGNHGQSIDLPLANTVPATVVVPVGNSIEKNAAMHSAWRRSHREGATSRTHPRSPTNWQIARSGIGFRTFIRCWCAASAPMRSSFFELCPTWTRSTYLSD